jgi:chromosome segregation ATPase
MWLLGVVLVLVLVDCGNRAPSCKDALARAARTLGEDASGFVEELTPECERSGWTAEQRSCLANAEDKQTLAACALILRATRAREESQAMQRAAQATQEAMKQTQDALDRAQDRLEMVAKAIEDYDRRLMEAETELMHAHNDADRTAAEAKLAALRKDKAELEAQIAAAKVEANKAADARRQILGGAPR